MVRIKREATAAEVRSWGVDNGFAVEGRGRLDTELIREFNRAHSSQGVRYVVKARKEVQLDENDGRVAAMVDQDSTPAPAPRQRTNSTSGRVAARSTPAQPSEGSPLANQPLVGVASIPPTVLEMLRAANAGGGESGHKAIVSIYAVVDI